MWHICVTHIPTLSSHVYMRIWRIYNFNDAYHICYIYVTQEHTQKPHPYTYMKNEFHTHIWNIRTADGACHIWYKYVTHKHALKPHPYAHMKNTQRQWGIPHMIYICHTKTHPQIPSIHVYMENACAIHVYEKCVSYTYRKMLYIRKWKMRCVHAYEKCVQCTYMKHEQHGWGMPHIIHICHT